MPCEVIWGHPGRVHQLQSHPFDSPPPSKSGNTSIYPLLLSRSTTQSLQMPLHILAIWPKEFSQFSRIQHNHQNIRFSSVDCQNTKLRYVSDCSHQSMLQCLNARTISTRLTIEEVQQCEQHRTSFTILPTLPAHSEIFGAGEIIPTRRMPPLRTILHLQMSTLARDLPLQSILPHPHSNSDHVQENWEGIQVPQGW